MTKRNYPEFPSDLFLMLETVGALVAIARGTTPADVVTVRVKDFLTVDMNRRVLLKIILPALNSDFFVLKTYKVSKMTTILSKRLRW